MALAHVLERLRDEMTRQGLSQQELARRANISKSQLSRILTGERNLGKHVRQALSHALGVELVTGVPISPAVQKALEEHAAMVRRAEADAADRRRRQDAKAPNQSVEALLAEVMTRLRELVERPGANRRRIKRHLVEQILLLGGEAFGPDPNRLDTGPPHAPPSTRRAPRPRVPPPQTSSGGRYAAEA